MGPWQGPLPDDPRYDPELLRDGDTRNVVDAYRYWTREAIVADIDNRRHPLHIAIENFGNDANIGAVVRTANAFAVDTVHIVGRRRWNRRGAMVTDRYQRLRHHDSTAELLAFAADAGLTVVAVDNVPGAVRIEQTALPRDCLMIFGQEGRASPRTPGPAPPLTVSIAQFGSTRSINAAVAAGIAMHTWITQHGEPQPRLVGQDQQSWIRYGPTALPAPKPRSRAHLKRLWGVPGTQLGVVAWPPARKYRCSGSGTTGGRHICWTAWSTRNCATRSPNDGRTIERQIRGHRLRNNLSWVNDYYDDMAWLALALERAGRLAGVERPKALDKLSEQFLNAWVPEDGGGIPWRKQDQFFNAPANGPGGDLPGALRPAAPCPADVGLDR